MYPSAKWVCTKTVVTKGDGHPPNKMFRMLYNYISGTNKEGKNKVA